MIKKHDNIDNFDIILFALKDLVSENHPVRAYDIYDTEYKT